MWKSLKNSLYRDTRENKICDSKRFFGCSWKNKKRVKPHVCVMYKRSFLRELETIPVWNCCDGQVGANRFSLYKSRWIPTTQVVHPLELVKRRSRRTRSPDHNCSLSSDPAQPNATQLLPHRWCSTWDMFPSVPCPVSQCSIISDSKEEDSWSSPSSHPARCWGELSDTLRCALYVACEYQEPGLESLHSASAKIQIICAQGAKQGSPIPRPRLPKTEGPRQRLTLWSSA